MKLTDRSSWGTSMSRFSLKRPPLALTVRPMRLSSFFCRDLAWRSLFWSSFALPAFMLFWMLCWIWAFCLFCASCILVR
ncbi:hypothetical protein BN1723_015215 [Verticillium longisporum]|uniref:Transmembrane protein n=1 Tax=Verticillium longisporum TaxID=100787 RepID=A0A0G4MTG0_VERLO|nr:hypothetical protein BN1723_015215 [Verticillium longisporum]